MHENGISIRRARPADVVHIASIETTSFQDPWSEGVLTGCLEDFPTTFFVALHGEDPVGFIAGGLEDTGQAIYGHIANLAVQTAFRRQGIGRLLVRREEHQFAIMSAEGVQLEVRASNSAARRFYRSLGYLDAIKVANYYADGEDAILMMKWFRF